MDAKELLRDAEMTEALFVLGTKGYSYVEKAECTDETGNIYVIETTRHVPPSFEAQVFWLCNRQPGKWKVDDEAMAQIFGKVHEQIADYDKKHSH